MEETKKIRVAITHGDTNGIGYELIYKTFAEPEILELCTPIIYGSPKVAAFHRKAIDAQASVNIIATAADAKDGKVNLVAAFDDDVKVELGVATDESAHAALMAIDKAIVDYRDGLFDVLVTTPIRLAGNSDGQQAPKSQAEYIAECFTEHEEAMTLLANDTLRIGLLTDNVAMKDVAGLITKDNLTATLKTFAKTLKRDFRVANPRIAVLSLNPTAATEEQEVITPVIEELIGEKVYAFGPYASDDFFANRLYGHFDGVLAMYHDQGIAPFMALTQADGVEILSGLPLICTSTLLNPGFDIAGKNVADENPLRQAIFKAIDICRNRANYDKPFANPLPKLYHEKKDESEKVRFSIPKKHENAYKRDQPKKES